MIVKKITEEKIDLIQYEVFKEQEMEQVDGSKVSVLVSMGRYIKEDIEREIEHLGKEIADKQAILDKINKC